MSQKAVSEIDRVIGAQIRMHRLAAGLTQEKLGYRLGITFQQVQKYENGSNRISASRLLEVAGILNVSVNTLVSMEKRPLETPKSIKEPDVRELIAGYAKLPDNLRALMMQLCAYLSDRRKSDEASQKA